MLTHLMARLNLPLTSQTYDGFPVLNIEDGGV
jgi:hypothetical protein